MSLSCVSSLAKTWILPPVYRETLEIYRLIIKLIALMLSQLIAIFDSTTPKSLSCSFIRRIWAQQLPRATYSTSIVERSTVFSFWKTKILTCNPLIDMSLKCFFYQSDIQQSQHKNVQQAWIHRLTISPRGSIGDFVISWLNIVELNESR